MCLRRNSRDSSTIQSQATRPPTVIKTQFKRRVLRSAYSGLKREHLFSDGPGHARLPEMIDRALSEAEGESLSTVSGGDNLQLKSLAGSASRQTGGVNFSILSEDLIWMGNPSPDE
jgi:hypothetical protein